MTAPKYICANWSPGCTECKEEGRYTCKNCRLVVYCSPACQKSHWTYHKPDCKSPLGWETWQPAWILEGRKPTFIGGGIGVHFGTGKYLWGNVPALDILRLESNEGEDYPGNLHLLFAASGDLRNVIKTVAGLPCTHHRSLDITINDRDFDIVARNLIMLLIALTVEQVKEAADCIIHIWYSALVRGSDIDILQGRIRPLIEDVCEKIKDKTPGRLLAKTWTFNQCSLRVVLEKSSWTRLLSFVSKPLGLSAEQANKIRAATTLADSRKDYRDRRMYSLSPLRRIAFNKFRQDGLLLPFGHSRCEFREPNPTLFQNNDNWPMKDSADPLDGWSWEEVAATSSGPASADVYGKLFYYLQGQVRGFLGQLSSLKITFRIFQMDIISLSDHVEDGTLSRVEVSNVADEGWLGIHRTLCLMVPLLQSPLENPHATLILLFLNAVDENLSDQDKLDSLTEQNAVQRLSKYLPPKRRLISPHDPEFAQFYLGLDLVTNFDNIFDRYLNNYKVCELGELLGAKMKEKHTIIEGWPFRLKLRPGQPGAQDEFDRRMSTGLSGKERYLEWKRVHQGM